MRHQNDGSIAVPICIFGIINPMDGVDVSVFGDDLMCLRDVAILLANLFETSEGIVRDIEARV